MHLVENRAQRWGREVYNNNNHNNNNTTDCILHRSCHGQVHLLYRQTRAALVYNNGRRRDVGFGEPTSPCTGLTHTHTHTHTEKYLSYPSNNTQVEQRINIARNFHYKICRQCLTFYKQDLTICRQYLTIYRHYLIIDRQYLAIYRNI
jgi:hypothetical protein